MAVSPLRSEGHCDVPLSQILLARIQQQGTSVADEMFPKVPVNKPSGRFYEYVPDSFYRSAARQRAPNTESAGTNFHINPNNFYNCKVNAVHVLVSNMVEDSMDAPIDLIRDSTLLIAQDLFIRRELDWRTAFFRPGIWTAFNGPNGTIIDWDPSNKAASGSFGGQWDLATSDPIRDIRYLVNRCHGKTGRKPNKLAISKDVETALLDHPVVIERISTNQTRIATLDLIAECMGLQKIVVSDTVVNSAQEGQVSNFGFMDSNCFLLVHAPDEAGIMVPAAGLQFAWTGYRNTSGMEATIRTIDDPHRESIKVEGATSYDMRMTGSDLGVFGRNILAKVS